jgi:iron complex transport system substrate-binding protein
VTRIVSFLPAGTEIVHALGAGEELVGRSHECDYPAAVSRLPVVSRPALDLEGRTPAEIEQAVAGQLKSGSSLYQVDERLLAELAPDVVLTQDLCQVCAPSGTELSRALAALPRKPAVVWLSPGSLAEIEENILAVGEAIGRPAAARALVATGRERIGRVAAAVEGAPLRRVVFLEWIDPCYCAGHWVPEMIALAGGSDPLGRPGADSVRVGWDAIAAARPELLVLAPCGFGLEGAARLGRELPALPGATAVAVDANAYFARPGPRAAEGIELLAQLCHPERYAWTNPGQPWVTLSA